MNALSQASSPYLLQHANQPVHWQEWSSSTLDAAKAQDKLIILSVGYSTCHWCHVMAHESFEDNQVAEYMNKHFISIKVDREERPDIDQTYMRAVQLMTGQGGWPLNVVLLPDGRPIWGGTYFPKEQWLASLQKLIEVRDTNAQAVEEYAAKLTEGVVISGSLAPAENNNPIDTEYLFAMRQNWSRRWDTIEGGPQKAPKFPLPNNYQYLLRYAIATEDEEALQQVHRTLDRMARGGIYDHVGGGFARYSVDGQWRVPHFEKMLYDNGQLLSLYAEAYKHSGHDDYKRVLLQTIAFLEREMKGVNGLYYSALDADTEGEEGRYYVWTTEEILQILGDDASTFFELTDWKGRAYWEEEKHVILQSPQASIPHPQWEDWMEALHSVREKRVKPGVDTKYLSAWNAIALSGLCHSASALQDEAIRESAIQLANDMDKTFRNGAKLWHAYGEDQGYIEGFLDDYALTIQAYMDVHSISGNAEWLQRAILLTESVLNQFSTEESPLLQYTAESGLIAQSVETEDNVIPSSNGVMATVLFRLGRGLGKSDWSQRAIDMHQYVFEESIRYPEGYSQWGQLAMDILGPTRELAIVGPGAGTSAFRYSRLYQPNTIVFATEDASELPPFQHRFIANQLTYYVCEEQRCQLPVNEEEEALKLIPNPPYYVD